MSKIFIVDIAKCTGCYNCQLVCKDEHCGNDWRPYAAPQPMTGHFWTRVEQKTVGSIPKVKVNYTPTFCNHCKDAPCIKAGEGAVCRRDDGLVIIDPEKAAGNKALVDSCPYGMIYWNEAEALPQKCTGCAHLLDNGVAVPRCVEACPTDALRFGDEAELAEDIAKASVLKPELGLGPQVYYLNIPGQFIGGTVYDPESEEIIEGARCVLSGSDAQFEALTDDFGDFWFKDLPKGRFDLSISAEGYIHVSYKDISTEDDCVNLGDIALEK